MLGCFILVAGFILINSFIEKKQEDISKVNAEWVSFEDSDIALEDIKSSTNKQTFIFNAKNTSKEPIGIDYKFQIESDGNTYKSELYIPSDYDVNPDMSTTIEVDFKMPEDVLKSDDTKIIITKSFGIEEQIITLNE